MILLQIILMEIVMVFPSVYLFSSLPFLFIIVLATLGTDVVRCARNRCIFAEERCPSDPVNEPAQKETLPNKYRNHISSTQVHILFPPISDNISLLSLLL